MGLFFAYFLINRIGLVMLTFSHKANIWHFSSNFTHWNANWYIYCNHRIPCINFTQEKNRNWSNYVTHHQNCCERKAIPSEFLKKKSSKFLYCTRNIVMNVSVTNRFSANIKFDPQIIRTRSRTQDTGSTYNSSGVKATTMTSRG